MLESNIETSFCEKSLDLADVYRNHQPSRVVSTTQDNTWIVSDTPSAILFARAVLPWTKPAVFAVNFDQNPAFLR